MQRIGIDKCHRQVEAGSLIGGTCCFEVEGHTLTVADDGGNINRQTTIIAIRPIDEFNSLVVTAVIDIQVMIIFRTNVTRELQHIVI